MSSFRAQVTQLGLDHQVQADASFSSINLAWTWLLAHRSDAERRADCSHGRCDVAIGEMVKRELCGSLHAHTPGYSGPADAGVLYTVDWSELDPHRWF